VPGRRPLDHAPGGSGASPAESPGPQPLDAPAVLRRPHELVAHVGRGEAVIPLERERGHQELGHRHLPELLEQAAQLPGEGAGVQDGVPGHRAAAEDTQGGRPDRLLLERLEPAAPEVGGEEGIRHGRGAIGTLLHPLAQLPKQRDQLPGHPLVGEEIAARVDLVHERLQRLGDHELRPVEEGLARGPGRLHSPGRGGRAEGKGQRNREGQGTHAQRAL
jgi:hypothetical protein